MLKLNGGLGTSMGLEKAKSLLEVKSGKTFLDLIAEQIKHTRQKYGACVRLKCGCAHVGMGVLLAGITGITCQTGNCAFDKQPKACCVDDARRVCAAAH